MERRLLFLLFLWPLAGVVLAALGLASAYWAGSWLLFLVYLLLPLTAVFCAFQLLHHADDPPGLVTGFTYIYLVAAACVGILLGQTVARPYLELRQGSAAQNLRVADAASYASPGYRHFRDGRILAEQTGTYIDSGFDSDGIYYEYQYHAAPVVGQSWRTGDPITLWVVTGSPELTVTDFATWDAPIQGMIATRSVSDYQRARQTAVAEHHLNAAEDAPLLRLYAQDFASLQSSLGRTLQLTLIIAALLGWLPLLLHTVQHARR